MLYRGLFNGPQIEWEVQKLRIHGSVTAPGFMDPEGVIVYHTAANRMFKVTCKDDEKPKEQVNHESQTVVKRRFARATGSL